MNVKINDNVLILTGKDQGKTGKVMSTSPKTGRVTVQGVNMQKHHQKARKATDVASIVEKEGPIDASNVMVICDTCGKATRVKHTFIEVDGKKKKVRVCKCGAVLDKSFKKQAKATEAPAEEAPKKRTRKRAQKAEKEAAKSEE